jgi:O-acetyl-ADP-ribose deacetylase (regulator of RNase III)
MTELSACQGDITELQVDAIVNAANQTLLGGGGVDGAIHRAAGPQLLEACRKLGGCPTGEARITPGFNLPARFVIHTVGPVWHGGNRNEVNLLARCYRESLALADTHQLHRIAFPAISTGNYGFPIEQAAKIAVDSVRDALRNAAAIERVIFCCFSQRDLQIYRRLLAQ